jgi:small subunit ribosomal protein S16
MLVIRLARTGRNKYPTYRIVAAESSRAATGKFVELLGHYNPHTKELVVKKDAVKKRLADGAQPSDSVAKLLKKEKVELPEWVSIQTKSRKPKKEPVPAAETPPAPVPEVPTEAAPETAESLPAEATAPDENPEPAVAQVATEQSAATEAAASEEPTVETAADTAAAADASAQASDGAAENAAEAADKAE